MSHESIKAAFSDAINHVAANISLYTVDPDRDLTRNRKIGVRIHREHPSYKL